MVVSGAICWQTAPPKLSFAIDSTAVGSSSEGQVPSQSSKPGSMHTTSLSSVSTSTDTASSTGTSEAASSHYSPVSKQGNRQSRAGVLSPSKTGGTCVHCPISACHAFIMFTNTNCTKDSVCGCPNNCTYIHHTV